MGCFSYKGGCDICERVHIKALKEELAWTTDKRLWAEISVVCKFRGFHDHLRIQRKFNP